jgi:hypothetical protein
MGLNKPWYLNYDELGVCHAHGMAHGRRIFLRCGGAGVYGAAHTVLIGV